MPAPRTSTSRSSAPPLTRVMPPVSVAPTTFALSMIWSSPPPTSISAPEAPAVRTAEPPAIVAPLKYVAAKFAALTAETVPPFCVRLVTVAL